MRPRRLDGKALFEPLQLHLQPLDLLEQFCLLGLALGFRLRLLCSREQLAGALQQLLLLLPLVHLVRVNVVIGGHHLGRLAVTDRLHGDLELALGAVGLRLRIGGSPFQGRYPASEVNDGACPEKPVHLT